MPSDVRSAERAMPDAATHALAQAHWKLNPPIRPSTSRISPTRNKPGHFREAMLRGLISESGTPPAVTSAWEYPRLSRTGIGQAKRPCTSLRR